jgi:hypothetical protein
MIIRPQGLLIGRFKYNTNIWLSFCIFGVVNVALCECGCGKEVQVKAYHKYKGMPRFINGHNRKGKGKVKCYMEHDYLYSLIQMDWQTPDEIGDVCGVSGSTIKKYLRKNGITYNGVASEKVRALPNDKDYILFMPGSKKIIKPTTIKAYTLKSESKSLEGYATLEIRSLMCKVYGLGYLSKQFNNNIKELLIDVIPLKDTPYVEVKDRKVTVVQVPYDMLTHNKESYINSTFKDLYGEDIDIIYY